MRLEAKNFKTFFVHTVVLRRERQIAISFIMFFIFSLIALIILWIILVTHQTGVKLWKKSVTFTLIDLMKTTPLFSFFIIVVIVKVCLMKRLSDALICF